MNGWDETDDEDQKKDDGEIFPPSSHSERAPLRPRVPKNVRYSLSPLSSPVGGAEPRLMSPIGSAATEFPVSRAVPTAFFFRGPIGVKSSVHAGGALLGIRHGVSISDDAECMEVCGLT